MPNAKKVLMFVGGVAATNIALEILAVRGIFNWRDIADMFAMKPTAGAVTSAPPTEGA